MITRGFANNTIITRGMGSQIAKAVREVIRRVSLITKQFLFKSEL